MSTECNSENDSQLTELSNTQLIFIDGLSEKDIRAILQEAAKGVCDEHVYDEYESEEDEQL